MYYQELYDKYSAAVKLRELSRDKNFLKLKELFDNKIMVNISITARPDIMPYLAGIKEVFAYVFKEAEQVDFYRAEVDKAMRS